MYTAASGSGSAHSYHTGHCHQRDIFRPSGGLPLHLTRRLRFSAALLANLGAPRRMR